MKKLMNIAISLLIVSCASKKNNSKKVYTMNGVAVPSWIYEVEKECPPAHLCASSEAESLEASEQKAKVALASVFESKVKSRFEVFNTSLNENEIETVKKSVESSVQVTVNEVLRGVKIKEHFKLGTIHFSYAALNKLKAASLFLSEIKKIDDELKFLYEKRSRTSILKMLRLLDKRYQLEDKMIIVGNRAPSQSINFSKVQALKYNTAKNKDVFVKVTAQTPRTIEKFLKDLLNQVGYKISNKLSQKSFLVEVNYSSKEEYLNVKGFSKYSFNTVISSKNSQRKQIGSISKTFTANGRNKQDAYLKAKSKIQNYIKNNLEKLNLD